MIFWQKNNHLNRDFNQWFKLHWFKSAKPAAVAFWDPPSGFQNLVKCVSTITTTSTTFDFCLTCLYTSYSGLGPGTPKVNLRNRSQAERPSCHSTNSIKILKDKVDENKCRPESHSMPLSVTSNSQWMVSLSSSPVTVLVKLYFTWITTTATQVLTVTDLTPARF